MTATHSTGKPAGVLLRLHCGRTACSVARFDNANAYWFEVTESRKYYGTSRLKRQGR